MKKIIFRTIATALVCCLNATSAAAQGNNSGQGGDDKDIQSIAQRVLKLEKSSEAFNVFLNLHTSYQERFDGDDQGGSFKGSQHEDGDAWSETESGQVAVVCRLLRCMGRSGPAWHCFG